MRKIFIIFALLLTPFFLSTPLFAQSSIDVQSIPGPTVAEKISDQMSESWPWYVARGSGILAAVSLILLMISGIGQITGFTFKFLEPLSAWASHRALGLVFGISVLLHMFVLLFDKFLKFSIFDVLIPFYSNFKPVKVGGVTFGSLYLALGIIALYITAAIVITSLLWINKKKRTWKVTHILSYVVMAFVFLHALIIGTDLNSGVLKIIWIAISIFVLLLTVLRARRAFTV